MPSPFPGMDPYLESSEIWPGFHHRLADELADQLNPRIEPKYYADIEVRTVVEEIVLGKRATVIPDTAIFEVPASKPARFSPDAATAVVIPEAPIRRDIRIPSETTLRAIQIYSTEFGELVTSIELLSPFNKRQQAGLQRYQHKRRKLLRSAVHLVEIDLLRSGIRPGPEVQEPALDTDYILLVNRSQEGALRTSEIWPVALSEALPIIPVPLLAPDPDVPLDLRAALDHIYERARYARRIDYRQPIPPPELRPAVAAWRKEALPGIGVTT